ncbi:cytochrome C biogenesis protein [Methanosarcina sp. KYL-1]|uniref:cytochrome c biogenesis protein n=1 Tax=Methanosarcina sp. KYL-1 TaxID=2602068 RepID=UPI002101991A|nr:cytochrome c biogenesis protein [Methanosarcina sp. KYL-1]MCQ1535822.1 cytochrome C biogenesis protein [Methanosarcina sp. KYL-1]
MKEQPVQLHHAIKGILGLLLCSFLLLSPAFGSPGQAEAVYVDYFYEEGCLKCQQALPVVTKVVERYPDINYSSHEIMADYSLMQEYGISSVPAVVVNRSFVIAYQDYGGNETLFEALLIEAIENPPSAPMTPESGVSGPEKPAGQNETASKLNPFIILTAGILAGFNPCLLAVMAFLASITLSQQGGKKEMLKITAGFSAGIFTMYMFAGLSILGTIDFLPGIRRTFTTLTVLLTGVLGLWHLYDAYWLKTHAKSTFRTPKALKDFMSRMGERNLLLLSFLAGGMFSLVKAPCVGAIYLSVLSFLSTKTNVTEGAIYLGLYNLGLLLPVIILGFLLSFGLSPTAVTEFREKRRVEIRLATGLILVLLALLLQLGLI